MPWSGQNTASLVFGDLVLIHLKGELKAKASPSR